MPKDDRPILLSLDGGGAKGWSQLPLISGLVSLVMKGAGTHGEKISIDDSAEEGRVGEEDIYPCDYFVSSCLVSQSYTYDFLKGPYRREWNWRDQRYFDGSPGDVNKAMQRCMEGSAGRV